MTDTYHHGATIREINDGWQNPPPLTTPTINEGRANAVYTSDPLDGGNAATVYTVAPIDGGNAGSCF